MNNFKKVIFVFIFCMVFAFSSVKAWNNLDQFHNSSFNSSFDSGSERDGITTDGSNRKKLTTTYAAVSSPSLYHACIISAAGYTYCGKGYPSNQTSVYTLITDLGLLHKHCALDYNGKK